ncbi:hypothetical protein [Massilia phosphatilytica]
MGGGNAPGITSPPTLRVLVGGHPCPRVPPHSIHDLDERPAHGPLRGIAVHADAARPAVLRDQRLLGAGSSTNSSVLTLAIRN